MEVEFLKVPLKKFGDEQNICLDKNLEYNFSDISISHGNHRNFFDGNEKIAEVFSSEGQLTIKIFTEKQVNIFTDIEAESCVIKSAGPICINGKCQLDSSISVFAEAACFLSGINCKGDVRLDVSEGLEFCAPIKAENLSINAELLTQDSSVIVKNQYDITTQAFQQSKGAKTITNKLRLVAYESEIIGEFLVRDETFLACNILNIGSEDAETTLQLLGKNYIHVGGCEVQGDTQFRIIHAADHSASEFMVDNVFSISDKTLVEFENIFFDATTLRNRGEIIEKNTFNEVDVLEQEGILNVVQSDLKVQKAFRHHDKAETDIKNSVFSVKDFDMRGGCFSLDETHCSVSNGHTFSGLFSINNHSELISDYNFLVYDNAQYKSNNSISTIQNNFSLNGFNEIKNSEIYCNSLKCYHSSAKIENVKIEAKNLIALANGAFLRKVKLYANEIRLQMFLDIDDVRLRASFICFDSEGGIVNNCLSNSDFLILEGGAPESALNFTKSRLVSKIISQRKHVKLDTSFLVGLSKDNISHNIEGQIDLNNARFITPNQMHNDDGAQLHLYNFSSICATRIWNESNLISEYSIIDADNLLQKNSSLTLKASVAKIKRTTLSRETDIILSEKASLQTEELYHGGRLSLKGGSVVVASSALITEKTSDLKSHYSTIKTGKFLSLGRAEICQSILSTEELSIYDQFNILDRSKVDSKKFATIAESGKSIIKDSTLFSNEINSIGVIEAEDAHLQAIEQMNMWPQSNTSLKGNSGLKAEKLGLQGDLNSHSKKIRIDGKDVKATPQISGGSKINIAEESKIIGDDLILCSDTIENLGQIDLSGDFHANGVTFNNQGSLTAKKSIFLGFDDAVLNFGSIESDSMTVHSNFFNLLGRVYVKKNFSSSGFFSVNGGFIFANNYVNDSLFSLNAGLNAPNFTADLKYIFSGSNLISFSKSLLSRALPNYINLLNLAFMIPGLVKTGFSLYDMFQKYDWDFLKSPRRHEWVPLICQVKSAAMFAANALGTYQGSISEVEKNHSYLSNLYTEALRFENYSFKNLESKIFDWKKMATEATGILGGNYTDTSLLLVNSGTSLAFNANKSNYVHLNTGIESSLFGHTINTHFLNNVGYSGGSDSAFLANSIVNSGNMTGLNHFKIKANSMKNAECGEVSGNGVKVELGNFSQLGELNLKNGLVNIDNFSDKNSSSSSFLNLQMLGTKFDTVGKVDAENVLFDYTDHFHSKRDAMLFFDTVQVKTKDYEHAGKLDYQNSVSINAETVTHAKDSIVNGAVTPETELFFPLKTPSETKSSTEDSVPAPTTEFKPKHIYSVIAEKVVLAGKLQGGDYTQVKGIASNGSDGKVKTFIVENSADFALTYGEFKAEKGEMSGKLSLSEFDIKIDHNHISEKADYSWNKVNYQGESLKSDGKLNLDQSHFSKLKKLHFTAAARETIKDTFFEAEYIKDASDLRYEGEVFFVGKYYKHSGNINKINLPEGSETENLFYVYATKATLNGSGSLDTGHFDIEHFSDSESFIAGTGDYEKYYFSDRLVHSTLDSFHSNQKIYRNCDITLKAKDIQYGAKYDHNKNLSFISSEGDVSLSHETHAKSVYINSAKNIHTNNLVYSEGQIHFDAIGNYYNWGGTLNGDVVSVTAAGIKNITAGSKAASSNKHYRVGDAGIINGRSKTFLEATTNDVENHGGVIRAGDYLQIVSAGDVLNLCNEITYQGKHDVVKEFDPGLISGGKGETTDGLGLFVKAKGHVFSEASDFISSGDNYIEGEKGVDFKARYHTYISKDKKKNKYFGFSKQHVIETTTTVKGSVVHSGNGRNIVRSGEGEITSVAGRFSSPGGTDMYAKGDVKLFSLKTQDRRHKSKSSFWGLNKKKRKEIHENASPVLFADNGVTRIHSAEGNVDARGAYFIGEGDLEINAGKRIMFGVDILNHSVHEKSQSFGVSFLGMGAWNAAKNSGNLWDAFSAEDATLAKINSLSQSQHVAETLSNAANLGIDLYNTTNNAMRGLANGALDEELMARYGLGGAGGFSPSIKLSMTKQDTKIKYQTQSQGGVDRGGNVKLVAGEGIDLENGVKVAAGKSFDANTKEILAQGAPLESSSKQKTESVHVSVTPTGQVQEAGFSYTKTQTSSTTHVNATLSAGENMKLHYQGGAMKKVELDCAHINTKTLDAETEILIVRGKQDVSEIKNESFSASSSGQVSCSSGKGTSKITNAHSGIYVKEGINTDGRVVKVGTLYTEGGKIETGGVNNFSADKVESTTLHDEEHYTGVGVSFNINDVERITSDKMPTNVAGEKAISTATLTLDYQNYKAEQKSVIYGEKGTHTDIKELIGEIQTQSRDGRHVTEDQKFNLNIDIPIINKVYLQESKKNIREGIKKLSKSLYPIKNNLEEHDPTELKSVENQEVEIKKIQKEKNEVDLSQSITQEVFEDALKNISFDSPEKELAFQTVLLKASEEMKENGAVSSAVERELSERVSDALLQVLKAGTEAGWSKVIENLGPQYEAGIINLLSNADTFENGLLKTYLGSKGLLISFTFNLVSSWQKGMDGNLVEDALANTAGDVVFGLSLEYVAGSSAGPIGWVFLGAGIVDTLTYSQEVVDPVYDQSYQDLQQAIDSFAQGNYGKAIFGQQLAFEQLESAVLAEGLHNLIQIPGNIGLGLKNLWNRTWSKNTVPKSFSDSESKAIKNLTKQGLFQNPVQKEGTTNVLENCEGFAP